MLKCLITNLWIFVIVLQYATAQSDSNKGYRISLSKSGWKFIGLDSEKESPEKHNVKEISLFQSDER